MKMRADLSGGIVYKLLMQIAHEWGVQEECVRTGILIGRGQWRNPETQRV